MAARRALALARRLSSRITSDWSLEIRIFSRRNAQGNTQRLPVGARILGVAYNDAAWCVRSSRLRNFALSFHLFIISEIVLKYQSSD